jgi:Lysozyme like domain
MATSATSSVPVDVDSAAVPKGREAIARLIVKSFADAGFGGSQQIAALANAIAESNLNPKATSAPPEQAVGLFQLNKAGGLGTGHTVAELEDPTTNINIILTEARKFDAFAKAASLEDAVSAFVHKIVRPADPAGAVARRLKIAERLAQKS